ncbi:MAG: hypothetical protein KGD59_07780 [Candidatus Heimdallarchaeota archaeon]|nr:hypothetical protein [Candidatus Heimdallarchaeota archaeon]MBY8994435.1 hypothetical protein [Candidatus Heimdallarchaeota archaeon]
MWRKVIVGSSGVFLQMQKRGVCLVRFDDKMGPGCVYHQGLDNNFAQKVCVKSHLSTMSLSSSSSLPEEEFIESVIPFLDEGYIAYSTFFFVEDDSARGGKRTLGIVTLVDRTEQMFLFKSIPEISATVKEIASDLTKNCDPNGALTSQIKEKLNQLLSLEDLKVDFDSTVDSVELIKKRISEEKIAIPQEIKDPGLSSILEGSFEFIFTRIPDGLDRIIHALLKNECILVFGQKDEIALTLATLRWFLPHKKIYNDLWTVPLLDAEALFSRTSDGTTLHALGIQSDSFYEILQLDNANSEAFETYYSQNKNIPIDSKVLINLDGGRVIGGISNRFCLKLLDAIKNQTFDKALVTIKEHIDYLLGRVNDLIVLLLTEADKGKLEQFINDSIEGEISLIMTIINEANPSLMDKIIITFSTYQLPIDILF